MANSVTGTITAIGVTQELTSKLGNAFKLRDIILAVRRFDPNTGEPITDNENTPQLTFSGDRCAELDKFQPGQVVTIYFDLQGRKYTDAAGITKIINDIKPYKIELYAPRNYAQPQQVQTTSAQPQSATIPSNPGFASPAPQQSATVQQPQYPQSGQGGYRPPF